MPSWMRYGARWNALPRWATWSCLPMLLSACAAPPAVVQHRIEPPPANLAQPCSEGPPIPTGDARLVDVMTVWAEREAAAAECRDRHAELVRAWPR